MANLRVGRRSGLVLRGGRNRRDTIWAGFFANVSLGAGSTAAVMTQLAAGGLSLRPFTVIRSRGFVFVGSDQEAASEEQIVTYGHCVVSEQAIAIGVTAIPTPFTDVESDLWWVYETVASRLVVTPAGTGSPGMTQYFDSKAMRKVEDGQDIVSVVETTSGSAGARVLTGVRLLLKLH